MYGTGICKNPEGDGLLEYNTGIQEFITGILEYKYNAWALGI